MDEVEALALMERVCAAWAERSSAAVGAAPAGAASITIDPTLSALLAQSSASSVKVRQLQRLWGGMGAVLECQANFTGSVLSAELIVKWVALPGGALSFGDQRKKFSYECESRFFETLADELRREAGCSVPAGLLVDRWGDGSINIVMSKLPGRSRSLGDAELGAAIEFLARMHGHTWGAARADEIVARGLQQQGC